VEKFLIAKSEPKIQSVHNTINTLQVLTTLVKETCPTEKDDIRSCSKHL